ncbi:hypothetical protein HMN09_00476000 [Mycena chlorophos]|uniref:Uncharacterized protein n=1 Tax=Mycena chlorophos TaxID=658473 RepID=A0A8H6TIP3_MYCCL|nr:hypothetical protein HMN09_00476000 [Mycena chlorophos]
MIIPTKDNDEPSSRVPSGSRPPSYHPSILTPSRDKPIVEEKYIHYRLYTSSGALPSFTAFSDDPFLGRLRTRSVPPPHTVATLKRCLRAAEGYGDGVFALYERYGDEEAMEDGQRVAVVSLESIGRTPELALVLLLVDDTVRTRVPAGWVPPSLATMNAMEPYIYYRLYTQTNEDTASLSVSSTDPSLGRISSLRIAPPYTLQSFLACVMSSSAEAKPAYAEADVFPSMDAVESVPHDTPLRAIPGALLDTDGAVVALPGSTEEHPLVLVSREETSTLLSRLPSISADESWTVPSPTTLLRRARTTNSPWLVRQRGRAALAIDTGAADAYAADVGGLGHERMPASWLRVQRTAANQAAGATTTRPGPADGDGDGVPVLGRPCLQRLRPRPSVQDTSAAVDVQRFVIY